MDHRIEGEIIFSGSLPAVDSLRPLVEKVSSEAIARAYGSRGEGRLTDWQVDGARLVLTIEASGPRPHQALLSMVKKLGEEIGRTLRLGVRSIRSPSYRVSFPTDGTSEGSLALPIPHEIQLQQGRAALTLTGLEEEALRDNWMDRAVALVEEKIRRRSYQGKEQFWSLLSQAPRREHQTTKDPTEEMIRRNWVRSGPTKGKWFLGPTAAHLLRVMERIARTEVLEPLGFDEVVQPHHDSFDILLKTGHLEGVPGEFYYVAEPRTRDPAAWESFTDTIKITRQVPTDQLAQLVGPPSAVSCYAQCPTIYWWLSGRTLAEESLPLKVFDRTAVSNRYESGGRHGLERVDEFHRIEPVYVGTPDQLKGLREELLSRYTRVFDEILELEWRTAWVTPFYLQQSGGLGIEDDAERVKGTIDFEAYLPYRGTREDSEWLEFQNLSIVGAKYTKAFTIRSPRAELWSGCSGIGLERWLTAFLAQKGLEVTDWPQKFRQAAEPLPKEPRFL